MKHKLLSILLGGAILTSVAFAQGKKISGQVTGSNGEGLSGVTVVIQGTNQTTQTDANGNYSISVPAGGKLVFRSIGFEDKTITVGNSNVYSITLNSNNSSLDEVLVVGYGTGKSVSSTVGSSVTISSKAIEARPTANALEALQGRVAGLSVLTSNGEPSVTQGVRLRGVGSLGASSTPLYVLDGVPLGSGSVLSLNPEDFASITVLKDASATSIYGARAANGVILITSKKGKGGESSTVMARAQKGINNLASTKMQDNLMNSAELQKFWLETGFQTQAQIDAVNKDFGGNDYQWYKAYYKENTAIDQYDLSVSGGGQKTQYYVSTSYFNQEGLMYRSAFDRLTLRSNISSKVNDWMKFSLNLSGGYDNRQSNPYGSNNTNGGLALLALPWYVPFDKDGKDYYDVTIPGLGRYSPKYLADNMLYNGANQQFNPNFTVTITPIKNLSIQTRAGMDYYNFRDTNKRLASYKPNLKNGTISEGYNQGIYRNINNTIDYFTNIGEDHKLSFLVGHESSDYLEKSFSASGSGLQDDRLMLLGNTIASSRSTASNQIEYAFNSFFGRIGYAYQNKYLVDATIRNDASSRFGENNKNATFYSIGGEWKAKSESFLKDINWLSDLTLRASYGTSGNSEIGNYASLATVGSTVYNAEPAWGVNSPGNPNLAWEKQAMSNFALDATLIDKINLRVELYNKKTTNMLMSVPYPFTSGFSAITANVGGLYNRGIEIELNVDVFKNKDYYLTPFFNFSYNKQKVTDLFQGKDYWIVPNTGVSYAIGKPVEFFYPVQKGVNSQTGLMEWYLPSDNIGVNTQDPSRVTSTFNTSVLQQSTGLPRYAPIIGGFGLNAGYKGFFLQSAFAFNLKKYLINNDRYFYANSYNFRGYNQLKEVQDYWKQPGDVTAYPKYGQTNQFDSGLIENASFLRLKTLQAGYSIPSKLLAKQKFFKGAKIYYIGRNLFTVTKYLGPDPEVDSNLALGVNPNTKQSSIGVELSF